MSMGVTTVEKVGRGHKGIWLSLERRMPLSIPPEDLSSLEETESDWRVPPTRGTTRAKNEGRRACAARTRHQMAPKRR